MKKLLMMIGAAAVAVGAMLPLSARADVVRIYDVDDYVQDGLVAHFDGIRNVGADVAHDSSATGWTNLVANAPHATFVSPTSETGEWQDNGYEFKGAADAGYAQLDDEISLGTSYTFQFATSINPLGQVYDASGTQTHFPTLLSDESNTYYVYLNKGSATTNLAFHASASGNIPYRQQKTSSLDYCTAMVDDEICYIFTGIEIPASTAGTSGGKGTRTGAALSPSRFCIGGANVSGQTKGLRGAIQSVRAYSRILTETELAWNRAIDDARFHNAETAGKGSDDANVILASNYEGVEGAEACGKYIVKGTHTFTAPERMLVGAGGYVLSGYTVETWDGSAWGAAVTNSGTSYTASSSGKVRLTWIWTRTIRGAADYGASDYVQGGLAAHFDGILNVGATAAHDSSATGWTNLVANAPHATFVSATLETGEWTDNGYEFKGASKTGFAELDSALDLGTSYTFELATEVDPLGQDYSASGTYPTLLNDTANNYSIYLNKGTTTNLAFRVNGAGAAYQPYIRQYTSPLDYCTAMVDGDNCYIFTGTEIPASTAVLNEGHASCTSASLSSRLCIGGASIVKSGSAYYNKGVSGVIHSVRMYSRILETAELEHNRLIDDIRFKGIGDVTVVNGAVGETGETGTSSLSDGVYNVEAGTWTITAESVRIKGYGTYWPKLLVETYNTSTGEWVATTARPQWTESYTIDKSALGGNRIRLTWTWEKRNGLIIFFR